MIEYFQPTKGFPALCNLKNRKIKKLNHFFSLQFFSLSTFSTCISSLVSLPVVFKNMFFDGSALLIIDLYLTSFLQNSHIRFPFGFRCFLMCFLRFLTALGPSNDFSQYSQSLWPKKDRNNELDMSKINIFHVITPNYKSCFCNSYIF